MGDAGEGLIDAELRIQERMEELERERTRKQIKAPRDPEAVDEEEKKTRLRERALADAGVQAMLEVFPAEIRDVEEM